MEEDTKRGKRPQLAEALGGFMLPVCDGPLRAMEVGEQCILYSPEIRSQLFMNGKIMPLSPGIPKSAEYISKKSGRVIVDGKYVDIHVGDILVLNFQEAIELLKKREVVPVSDEHFRL